MADKKFSDFTVQTDLSNFDGLVGFDVISSEVNGWVATV